jgi:hypothetical protein
MRNAGSSRTIVNLLGESHLFYFNKVFVQYLFAYSGDIEIIYCLKNGLLEAGPYAQTIVDGKITFDGIFYVLTRMRPTFLVLDIAWNFVKSADVSNVLFHYLIEIVFNQLAEEYAFVKAVTQVLMQKLETIVDRQQDERRLLAFLQFYERFVWNNKKIHEFTEKYQAFLAKNYIKFPDMFVALQAHSKRMNDLLIEHSDSLTKFKLQTEGESSGLKRTKSLGSFSKFCDIQTKFANNVLLFSQKNILNKLEIEVVQKRPSREEMEVNTEGDE